MAVELAKSGWHVALCDIKPEGLQETAQLVTQAGGIPRIEIHDVRHEQEWRDLEQRLRRDWPRLDLLVNNAGVCTSGEVGEFDVANWDWLMSINLRGVMLGCHTLLAWLKEHPQRSYILNISSITAFLPGMGMAAYNASKAGVVALSETLYMELRPHRVSVTVACPWFIQTNLLNEGRFHKPEDKLTGQDLMKASPITPERFARNALAATFGRRMVKVIGPIAALLAWWKVNMPQWFLLTARFFTLRRKNWVKTQTEKLEQKQNP